MVERHADHVRHIDQLRAFLTGGHLQPNDAAALDQRTLGGLLLDYGADAQLAGDHDRLSFQVNILLQTLARFIDVDVGDARHAHQRTV